MVEELVEHWRTFHVERIAHEILAKGREAAGDAVEKVDARLPEGGGGVVRREVNRMVPKALKPKCSGIARYEKPLRCVGWGAPEDRLIPEDLNAALTELGALRDVLVHRAGRVDTAALGQAPTLHYRKGQFVRISRDDYRRYSAAIRCYAQEISFRGVRGWPEVTDERDGPDLARWRDYVRINA